MITVYKNNSVCEMVLGKQQKTSSLYRWIKFTVFSDVESGCLILNTLAGRLIFIPNYTAKQLKENPNIISECDDLFENWFLVPNDTDEVTLCDQLRDILKIMLKPNPVSSYTILTTTACNARCPYCFEKDLTPVFMGEDIAQKTADFILRSKKTNTVSLKWFGGEPLIHIKPMDTVCSILSSNDVTYASGMVTNGFCLIRK